MPITPEKPVEKAPSRKLNCPICGQSNACIPASTGSFSEPCWCTSVRFSQQALEQVPAQRRGKACICRKCAERFNP